MTAAKGGTLTFMVGGEDEAYEKATKLLQHMGKYVIHIGATGTGQVIQIQSIVTVPKKYNLNFHNCCKTCKLQSQRNRIW